jgi:hypothetical protein
MINSLPFVSCYSTQDINSGNTTIKNKQTKIIVFDILRTPAVIPKVFQLAVKSELKNRKTHQNP